MRSIHLRYLRLDYSPTVGYKYHPASKTIPIVTAKEAFKSALTAIKAAFAPIVVTPSVKAGYKKSNISRSLKNEETVSDHDGEMAKGKSNSLTGSSSKTAFVTSNKQITRKPWYGCERKELSTEDRHYVAILRALYPTKSHASELRCSFLI